VDASPLTPKSFPHLGVVGLARQSSALDTIGGLLPSREKPGTRNEVETPGDPGTLFRLRIDASVIAKGLTAGQAHALSEKSLIHAYRDR
jgi:hypothetical protein